MSVSFEILEAILEKIPPNPDHLIDALHEIQAEFNFIPSEALQAACHHVGVPQSRGWAVATFYRAFRLEPKGEHDISVCVGTACHVRGSANLYEKFKRNLALEAEEGTTPDLRFSLGKVRCLGCCCMAPVAKVDEEIHGGLDQGKAQRLLEGLKQEVGHENQQCGRSLSSQRGRFEETLPAAATENSGGNGHMRACRGG